VMGYAVGAVIGLKLFDKVAMSWGDIAVWCLTFLFVASLLEWINKEYF